MYICIHVYVYIYKGLPPETNIVLFASPPAESCRSEGVVFGNVQYDHSYLHLVTYLICIYTFAAVAREGDMIKKTEKE